MGEFSEIIKLQREFFFSGKTKEIEFRIVQLRKLRNAIKKNMSEILNALYLDLNKSKLEAYVTEIKIVMSEIDCAINNVRKWSAPKRKRPSILFALSQGYVYPEPYGVVLIMSPWNYPFQLTIAPLIGAIAAGNCTVIKPSAYSKHTSSVISQIIQNVFDENFVAVVQGSRNENANLLAEKFDYIFFTGSVEVGKVVMRSAARNLIPVTLELGGKSPCIVDKTANVDLAARRIVMGKFINAGQTCVAPDYLLVDRQVKEKLVKLLIKYIRLFYGDDPLRCKWYPKIINRKHFDRLRDLMKSGGNLIFGGQCCELSNRIEPTLIDCVSGDDLIMKEEVFGPILPILEFDCLSEVVSFVRNRPKPLALYCFSSNSRIQKFFVKNLSFGGGCINHTLVHLANPQLAFGGVGESGMGQYHGVASFNTFSHDKSILSFPL